MEQLHDVKVLLRAHGEPPATYELARRNNIEIIDATCPVVLRLQKRIKKEYDTRSDRPKQIVIYGKRGHAEVLGLIGQTEGTAIVIESLEEAKQLDYESSKVVHLAKKLTHTHSWLSHPSWSARQHRPRTQVWLL